jgi:hypothetical protein
VPSSWALAVNYCLSKSSPSDRCALRCAEGATMKKHTTARSHHLLAAMTAALLLTACGEESAQDAASQATPPVDTATAAVPANSAPVITGEPVTEVTAAAAYVFQPSVVDPDGDTLTFSAEGLPAWATLDPGTGRISGMPEESDEGETADIQLTVSDGKQISSLKWFRILIGRRTKPSETIPGTAPPVISGTPPTTATIGSQFTFTPTASDPDTLQLTFSISNKPAWASFSTSTGRLSGTPGAGQAGTYSNIVIGVSDGRAPVALPAFTVQVKAAPNAAPQITGTPSGAATVGSAYSFTPAASDVDKQPLGFSIANKPSWASFNTATGALTGTPGAGNVGSFANIVISVSDGLSQAALPAFGITVQAAANGSPTITGQPATSVRVGGSYSFQPTASDPNGDALTFSITGKPAWATFSTATGKLTGQPGSGSEGSYANIVISVSDGKANVGLASFGILVSAPTTGSATLSWTPPTQNSDGSQLNNLAGYRIYYGTNPSALSTSIQVTNAGLTSYTVGNLPQGTYHFALASYTTDGVESEAAPAGSKTIL